MRSKYGINCQIETATQFGYFTPVGYQEVVPGDTLSGTMTVKAISDTTVRPIMNRSHFDLLAAYVPYRLVWSGFPDFLLSGTGTVPTVNEIFPFNFEKELNLTTNTLNVAFQRRCYNKVWNHFMRLNGQAEAAEDAAAALACYNRPTTFHASDPDVGAPTNATIDTSGTSTTVSDVRLAFQEDRFNRMREYYGDRYVDYLAAVGVKVSWSVLEEPELLGYSRGEMKYNILNPATADATTPGAPEGAQGGYWTATNNLRLRRKFFPEHGLVCFFACPKLEVLSYDAQYPWLFHDAQDDFWSPERDGMTNYSYDDKIWLGNTGSSTVVIPRWEHLRKGVNMTAHTSGGAVGSFLLQNATAVTDYLSVRGDTTNLNAIFQDALGIDIPGSASQAHLALDGTMAFEKLSPVANRSSVIR